MSEQIVPTAVVLWAPFRLLLSSSLLALGRSVGYETSQQIGVSWGCARRLWNSLGTISLRVAYGDLPVFRSGELIRVICGQEYPASNENDQGLSNKGRLVASLALRVERLGAWQQNYRNPAFRLTEHMLYTSNRYGDFLLLRKRAIHMTKNPQNVFF